MYNLRVFCNVNFEEKNSLCLFITILVYILREEISTLKLINYDNVNTKLTIYEIKSILPKNYS